MSDSHDTGDAPKADTGAENGLRAVTGAAEHAPGHDADDMSSLVDRSASLNWMIDQQSQDAGSAKPTTVTPWQPSEEDSKPQFDPRTARRWPFELHSVGYYSRLLVARAVGGAMPPFVDEMALTAAWRTLTNSEIQALWAVGETGSDKASTAADEILMRVATQRLRVRTAIRQADELHALDQQVTVDNALVTEISNDLTAAARDWIDPLVREAVHGESERVKDARAIRKDLAYARQELERSVARLSGKPDPKMDLPSGPAPVAEPARKKAVPPRGVSEVRHERSQGLFASALKGLVAIAVLGGTVFLFARDFMGATALPIIAHATTVVPIAVVAPAAPLPPGAPTAPPPSGAANAPQPESALPAPAFTAREKECIKMAGPRQSLEPTSAHVYGTMLMKDNSTALMADSSHREQEVRVGDYLGAHCWKVSVIDIDSITLMSNETGTSGPKTMRMSVSSQHDQRPKHGRW